VDQQVKAKLQNLQKTPYKIFKSLVPSMPITVAARFKT
jgi:hypothetical protein